MFLTDKTTRNGKLEVVVLGEKGHYPAEDGSALNLALVILADDTWTNLHFITELQYTGQNTTTSNTSLQILNLGTRLVDIERTDDDHVWSGSEVARRNRDLRDQIFVDRINVELELRGDWNDRAAVCDSSLDELENRVVVLRGCLLSHQIDLVLKNDNVAELHDLYGRKMLGSLRLRASFVTGNEEECGVHDGGA